MKGYNSENKKNKTKDKFIDINLNGNFELIQPKKLIDIKDNKLNNVEFYEIMKDNKEKYNIKSGKSKIDDMYNDTDFDFGYREVLQTEPVVSNKYI